MSRAKITFFPKVDTDGYAMNNVDLVEKYSGWSYNTDDYATDGSIMTDNVSGIANVNNTYWVKFKAKSGYKFSTVHKTNSGGTANNGEFTIDADGSVTVYPWETGTASIINNYLYVEVVEDTGTEYTVTSDLTNCTSDHETSYDEGSEVAIVLTAKDGYRFNDVPTMTMNDATMNFVVSENQTTAALTFVITGNVTIKAVAEHLPHKLTTDLTNCTCNYSGYVPHGTVTLIITANEGYILNGAVKVKEGYTTNTYSDFTQGGTVCTITKEVDSDVSITASAIIQPEQISTFTNLYKVDNDILNELSKVRFKEVEGQTVDYGSFITALMKIPFALPGTMIGSTDSIQLGNYDSNVDAPIVQKYVLAVDIGRIHVPEKYHNIYDYKDTKCILHLPYCDNIEVQTEYIMNRNISIEYRVDLYSGNATVNVISDFTNEIVASTNFNIARNIPFIQEQNNSVVSSVKNVLDNGVRTAFIEVVRNIPYNASTVFGNETVDYGILENYTGYIKVSDILLNIHATNEDKNEIETLLRNGVYINE